MSRKSSQLPPQPYELRIYQIALGAIGVASLAAGNVAIALASLAMMGFVAFVTSTSKK